MSTARISRLPAAGERRAHHGFDDRHRNAHLGKRLHPFEHLFGKARLARGDLQLRRARDPVDGLVKREQHRLVRGVHADEHRDAQHDARDRQQASAQGACAHTAS